MDTPISSCLLDTQKQAAFGRTDMDADCAEASNFSGTSMDTEISICTFIHNTRLNAQMQTGVPGQPTSSVQVSLKTARIMLSA